MVEREYILQELMKKGGLTGRAAKMFLNNESDGHKFILECYRHCHHANAYSFWGGELIEKIVAYYNQYNKTTVNKRIKQQQ